MNKSISNSDSNIERYKKLIEDTEMELDKIVEKCQQLIDSIVNISAKKDLVITPTS